MMEVSKADWKLFRSRIADWQEAYMERLIKEYAELLNGEGAASDKFWELEKRMSGYHQNKEHWNTIILDGTVPDNEIKRMIAESYELVKGHRKTHLQGARVERCER